MPTRLLFKVKYQNVLDTVVMISDLLSVSSINESVVLPQ